MQEAPLPLPLSLTLLCVFCYATRLKSTGHTAKWHVRQHKLHILGSTLQYADAINHNKRPHCADSRTMGQRNTNNNNKLRTIELCLVGRGKALQHAARSAQHLFLPHAIKIGLLIILDTAPHTENACAKLYTHTQRESFFFARLDEILLPSSLGLMMLVGACQAQSCVDQVKQT